MCGYCHVPSSYLGSGRDVCGCVMSPTLGIYWVDLGFVNNCKESQLWLVLLRYSADVVSAFPWVVTVTINTVLFAYSCGPLWHRVFVLGHVLVLSLGLEPNTYVDEYLWTLRPHRNYLTDFHDYSDELFLLKVTL